MTIPPWYSLFDRQRLDRGYQRCSPGRVRAKPESSGYRDAQRAKHYLRRNARLPFCGERNERRSERAEGCPGHPTAKSQDYSLQQELSEDVLWTRSDGHAQPDFCGPFLYRHQHKGENPCSSNHKRDRRHACRKQVERLHDLLLDCKHLGLVLDGKIVTPSTQLKAMTLPEQHADFGLCLVHRFRVPNTYEYRIYPIRVEDAPQGCADRDHDLAIFLRSIGKHAFRFENPDDLERHVANPDFIPN